MEQDLGARTKLAVLASQLGQGTARCVCATFTLCELPHFLSYGAPVPDEPRNNVCPLGKVRSRPFARRDPSFDW